MNKDKFYTCIDYGASKIRLGAFETENSKNLFISEKNSISNFSLDSFDLNDSKYKLNELIKEAENKLNTHIKNVNLLIDSPDVTSIDFSIKKNIEDKILDNEELKYYIQEAKNIFQNNNPQKKILHMLIVKFNLDGKIYLDLPSKITNVKSLVIEIKFLCIPLTFFNKLNEVFNENFITISEIYCSSYVKSTSYIKFFENFNLKVFLDIGYKKSSTIVFYKNKLVFYNTTPVGGNHITKDLSILLKIDESTSEKIKKSFNKSEFTFSNNDLNENKQIKNKLVKNISTDMLRKVIYARVDEIIKLSLENINFENFIEEDGESILIFTGEGSKILNRNSIYLDNKFNIFKEMNFFEDESKNVCESAREFIEKNKYLEVNFVPKIPKKRGFFEKLFYIFN